MSPVLSPHSSPRSHTPANMQDAGDFKIGAPAPPSAPVSQAKSSGSSGPAFGVPPKLEVGRPPPLTSARLSQASPDKLQPGACWALMGMLVTWAVLMLYIG